MIADAMRLLRGPKLRSLGAVLMTTGVVLAGAGSAQATIVYVGSSNAQTSTAGATTLPIAAPTSVAAGDIEIATISAQGSSAITPPSGWNQIITSQVGTLLHQVSYWHLAGSSELTSTWMFAASSKAAGGILAYSGVDTTAIVDATGQATGTSGTTASIPTVTDDYAGDLVLGLASFNNTGTLTAGSGTTSRFASVLSTTNGPTLLGQDVEQASAGATTPQTVTDASSATAWAGQAIALKASSATGELTVTTSATPSFSANLNSGDTTATYPVALDTVASISPPPGWNETITSTTFAGGGHSLPTGASTIKTAPTTACVTSSASCRNPTNAVSYPVAVPAGATAPTAVKFFNAASGTGAGEFTITPTVSVTVPQNAFAGTYTSTVTIAIVSGP